MLLPKRGVLTDAQGTVLWAWENNDPTREFDLLPPLTTNAAGETISVAPPDAIIVDVDEALEPEELPQVYGDMADKGLRVRRVDGTWRFFKVIREYLVPSEEVHRLRDARQDVPALEAEVPHPIEAIRAARRALVAQRQAREP
jgi:hypothetical protein